MLEQLVGVDDEFMKLFLSNHSNASLSMGIYTKKELFIGIYVNINIM